MKLPSFDYQSPTSLAEVIRILTQEQGSAKLLAGGQSLVPVMAFRLASPTVLVDLANVAGLDGITVDDTGVSIGAMVRWCDIEKDHRLRDACPLVSAAVEHIAHYQIRNRGTIGGSLAHADPAAEMPGIAATCDAQLEVAGPSGTRLIAARDFFLGPLTTSLADDEVLKAVRFPVWPARRRWAFDEFAQRRGDFAFAGIAVYYDEAADGSVVNAHVGVIGATDVPRRLEAVERAIDGKRLDDAVIAAAAAIAAASVQPDGDIHASAAYRRSLVGTLVERTLSTASTRSFPS
jgi:carbon-monoxide dehydrogenase medium subunit